MVITPFQKRVYSAARRIPRGKVATYAMIAAAIGCRSPRAVGQALRKNPFAPVVPCHRVIASALTPGGFNGRKSGPEIRRKLHLLAREGVRFADGVLSDHRKLMKTLIFTMVMLVVVASQVMAEFDATQFVASARSQIGVTTQYDGSYRKLSYPGGDVPRETGVCCDVIVRALREQKLDLQQLVNEDMRRSFKAYPQNWGLKKPDSNIDHRRVPNLACFFRRAGWALEESAEISDYLPGDIVTWKLTSGLPHVGIVSDKKTTAGIPMMIHNIGGGTQEEDVLFRFTITGHFRPHRMVNQQVQSGARKSASG